MSLMPSITYEEIMDGGVGDEGKLFNGEKLKKKIIIVIASKKL